MTFADGSEAIYAISATASNWTDWVLQAQTGPTTIAGIGDTKIVSFGLPGFSSQGCAVLANLMADSDSSVTTANNAAVITITNGGAPAVLARKGDLVSSDAEGNAQTGVKINKFRDPVMGATGKVAFMFTASDPAEKSITAQFAQPAIAYSSDGTTWSVIANTGAAAPGGGHWNRLLSMVLPEGAASGPIFTGTLKASPTEGVKKSDNLDIWAVNSSGTLQLLLSDDDAVMLGDVSKTLRTFVALAPSVKSGGVASGCDDNGNVAITAIFNDGTRAIVDLPVP